MNKRVKFLIPNVAAAAVLTLVALVGHAEGDKSCDRHKPHAGFEGHGEPGFQHPHMAFRDLDLSEEQKVKVKAIFDQQKQQREQKFKELRESFKTLHEAAKTEPYDTKKVQDLANQQARLQADLIVMRTQAAHEVFALLTPEQKQKWEQREQKRPHDRS